MNLFYKVQKVLLWTALALSITLLANAIIEQYAIIIIIRLKDDL